MNALQDTDVNLQISLLQIDFWIYYTLLLLCHGLQELVYYRL